MKVLVAVPCMDQVPAQFAQSIATLNSVGECSIAFQMGSLVYDSRNALAANALKMEADYVLWLDSDMVFPPDVLERLMKDRDKGDIITAVYYRRVAPYSPVLLDKLEIDDTGCEWTNMKKVPDKGISRWQAVVSAACSCRRRSSRMSLPSLAICLHRSKASARIFPSVGVLASADIRSSAIRTSSLAMSVTISLIRSFSKHTEVP